LEKTQWAETHSGVCKCSHDNKNGMNNDFVNEVRIVESWTGNARAWVSAVREGRIDSRRKATNRAIVDAVLSRSPGSVLDVGCGEGWLSRELTGKGVHVTGIDGVPGLVEAARNAGGGEFHTMSYGEIAAGRLGFRVDVIVCNFSLLGKESVEGLLRAAPSVLSPRGSIVVQTLHPVAVCGDLPYRDGWRQGSWAGFGSEFTEPAPWYFRTLHGWFELFTAAGLELREVHEPLHPETGQPASIIFIGEAAARRFC
jgi:2-polyprenyl-3-methyl-5-hydroxy-6-metoxy-1,4-benzoquinol methylase